MVDPPKYSIPEVGVQCAPDRASLARREEGAYWLYVTNEQHRQRRSEQVHWSLTYGELYQNRWRNHNPIGGAWGTLVAIMRILAGTLILVAAVIQLLLGVLLVFSAHNTEQEARAEAGDLSAVSADLVSEEELAAMRKVGDKEAGSAGQRPFLLGIAALALAALQLAAGVLTLLRRAPLLMLCSGSLSLLCLAAALFLEGGGKTAGIASILLSAGLIIAGLDMRLRARRARRQNQTPASG